jgi:hypothetical protein
LIINELSVKTHENTGKLSAKPFSSHSFLATATEIKNKPNMNPKTQHPHNPNHQNQKNQINQWFRQKSTSNCMQTGKVNSIDNQ